jgi:hypothetical protein
LVDPPKPVDPIKSDGEKRPPEKEKTNTTTLDSNPVKLDPVTPDKKDLVDLLKPLDPIKSNGEKRQEGSKSTGLKTDLNVDTVLPKKLPAGEKGTNTLTPGTTVSVKCITHTANEKEAKKGSPTNYDNKSSSGENCQEEGKVVNKSTEKAGTETTR